MSCQVLNAESSDEGEIPDTLPDEEMEDTLADATNPDLVDAKMEVAEPKPPMTAVKGGVPKPPPVCSCSLRLARVVEAIPLTHRSPSDWFSAQGLQAQSQPQALSLEICQPAKLRYQQWLRCQQVRLPQSRLKNWRPHQRSAHLCLQRLKEVALCQRLL